MKTPKLLYPLLIFCLIPISISAKWVKVTDTSLTNGTYAIIETETNRALAEIVKIDNTSFYYGKATTSANIFVFDENGITYSIPEGTMLLTLEQDESNKFWLLADNNRYLRIGYSDKLSLSFSETKTNCWIYKPNDQHSYLHFILGDNEYGLICNNGEFSNRPNNTYVNNDTKAQLVRKEKDETRHKITANTYGTLCLPRAVVAGDFFGAEFYRILYREGSAEAPTALVLEQVESLEAGMPYIYFTTDTEMSWYLSGESGIAGKENGLVGTLDEITESSQLEDKWYISNNEICQIGNNCTLAANRAYIDMSQVPTQAQATSVPGRKQIRLGQPGTATFIPLYPVQSVRPSKVLLDNTILIQRNNHLYDMQGRVVR